MRRFPVTQWSLVARAGLASVDSRREALGVLLRRYQPALRAHLVVQKRVTPEAADDLLQGFICDKVVEQGLLAAADRGRGRFRNFLLTALDRYVIDHARFDAAKKRSPGDTAFADLQRIETAAATPEPSEAFAVAWAREVLAEAVRRMETECIGGNRPDLWAVFRCRVLEPTLTGAAPVPYADLIARFGFRSPTQASNVVITSKRMFERVLRQVVGEYAEDESQIDREIQELRAVLECTR